MDVTTKMAVRGQATPNYGEGNERPPHINHRGEQLVTLGLPPLTTLVAMGDSWWARTSTAAAPVTAIPTTAALLGLWNGDRTKSYVIDSVFAVVVANTAAIQGLSILGNVSLQQVLAALANTIPPRGMLANRAYDGSARVAVGITIDADNGVAANWQPLGSSPAHQNTPQIGTTLDVDLKGKIILPPGGQLALTVLAGAATATSVQLGVRWHELVLPPAV